MIFIDGGDAQKHEDYGFRGTTEHLHSVLYCRMGLVGYVGLHVVFHRDSAERNPERI